MLGLAWATLPDLPGYRTGVIMVGLARCIAMVIIWNNLARGNTEYCAILVVVNALLQIALFSPYSVFFINVISHTHDDESQKVSYGNVAISVLIVSSPHIPNLLLSLISFKSKVPRNSSYRRNNYTIWSHLLHQSSVLREEIPSALLALLPHWLAIHHNCLVCVPRPQDLARHRARFPRMRPTDSLLCHHVDGYLPSYTTPL